MQRVHRKNIFLYLLPALIVVVVFFLFPLAFLLATSLTDWMGGTLSNLSFVWLKHYLGLFRDREFWQTMWNTFIWYAAGVVLHIPICLIVAMILARHPPGWRLLRTIYFFPNVVAQLILAWMWYFIYKPDVGILNSLLRLLGLERFAIHWLGTSATVLGALIFSWLFNIGFFMIIFMAQIGTIPSELYEAADIDGASGTQKELYITVPMLWGTIAISMLLVLTFTFRTFELPFIMTSGGPGVASQILPLMMYKKFLASSGAIANAIGFMMVLVGVLAVYLVRRFVGERRASL